MGDGSKKDDFRQNRDLVYQILKKQYLPQGYTLILNGDIEELQKFSLSSIHKAYSDFFTLFKEFKEKNRLIKIWGNHDALLTQMGDTDPLGPVYEGIRLTFEGHRLWITHGHQATLLYNRFNSMVGFFLKYILNPLGIKNLYFAADSRKQFQTERRIYHFSRLRRIVSIIGHTHRPLFESLSKKEDIKLRIESILRKYSKAPEKKKKILQERLRALQEEWNSLSKKQQKEKMFPNGLYTKDLLQPNLFNSGCGIGKNGITGLEICGGKIKLIHWIDERRGDRFYDPKKKRRPLESAPHYQRILLKQDDLNYIFNRISLLN